MAEKFHQNVTIGLVGGAYGGAKIESLSSKLW